MSSHREGGRALLCVTPSQLEQRHVWANCLTVHRSYASSLMRAALMTASPANVIRLCKRVVETQILIYFQRVQNGGGVSCYHKVSILYTAKPAARKRLHNPRLSGKKNVQAVCGAVWHKEMLSGCGAQPVHLNAQCQWCRKCRSAVSIWKEAGVCFCVFCCFVCPLTQQA